MQLFFCTANFALGAPDIISRIVKEGHELSSHGYCHSEQRQDCYKESKDILEMLSGKSINGYRQPRLGKINIELIKKAGYLYDASLNPTLIPGRYNELSAPRYPHKEKGLVRVPASVTPIFRIPIFWLSFYPFGFIYEPLS